MPWRWALTTGCGPLGTTARASWAKTHIRSAAPALSWCRACQTAPWCSLWSQVGSWLSHVFHCQTTAAACRYKTTTLSFGVRPSLAHMFVLRQCLSTSSAVEPSNST